MSTVISTQKKSYASRHKSHYFKQPVIFKSFSLIGLALLLAANVWGFTTGSNSEVGADFKVTGELQVGSVGSAAGDGIVTSAEIFPNSDTKLATTAAITAHIESQIQTLTVKAVSTQTKSLSEAETYCLAQNGRIPTLAELFKLCTTTTACTSHNYYVWTKTRSEGKQLIFTPSDSSMHGVNSEVPTPHRTLCIAGN